MHFLLIFLWTLFLGCNSFAQTSPCPKLIKRLIQRPDLVLLPKLEKGSFEIVRAEEAMPTLFPESKSPKWPLLMRMAHHYKLLFSHQDAQEELNFIIPALAGNTPDLRALFKIEQLFAKIPTQVLRDLDYLVVNPTPYKREKEYIKNLKYLPYSSKEAEEHGLAATSGVNSFAKVHINLYYPRISEAEFLPLLYTLYHEFGHIVANRHYGGWTPDERWKEARRADKFIVIYAANSLSEDFAETVRFYLTSEGGLYNPRPRKLFARRFALLDEIFEVDRSLLEEVVEVEK